MSLTEKQREVLRTLADYEEPVSARQLADRMERPAFRTSVFSYDEVYGQLRALERRGLVTRSRGERANVWLLTVAGQDALS